MAHSGRRFCLALIAISELMGALGFAQTDARVSHRSQIPAAASHGVMLILGQDQTSELSGSSALKTCLDICGPPSPRQSMFAGTCAERRE
jgi:hypothetical protein